MLQEFKRPKYDENLSSSVSEELVKIFEKRRTIRQYSKEKPDREIILNAIRVASLAPSGANAQPWHFAVIENQALKEEIKDKCEKEEFDFYHKNPNQKWIEDLKHLHTHEKKEFLTQAPYLIAIFYSHYSHDQSGEKKTHYYAKESVGLAAGMLLSSLHLCGLNTLTYTPKRMQFLNDLLERPKNERPFMIIACGVAPTDCEVPQISKKTIHEVTNYYQNP